MIISHLVAGNGQRVDKALRKRTVDGNGHALGQNVAISALECGNLAELVELQVVRRDTLGWLGVDILEVKLVGLCDSENGGGAWVALFQVSVTA